MAKKKEDGISELEKLRQSIKEAELTIEFEDKDEYVLLNIDLDNFNLKGYERNRSSSYGHTYDPLSAYKKELAKLLNPEILKHIPTPLLGYCYFEIERYLTLPKGVSQIKREAAMSRSYRPTKKPDVDNIEKLIFDLFNKLIYHDDAQIIRNVTDKYYGERHRTVMKVKIYKEEFKAKRGKK